MDNMLGHMRWGVEKENQARKDSFLNCNLYFRQKLDKAKNGGEMCASSRIFKERMFGTSRIFYLEEISTCNKEPCLPGNEQFIFRKKKKYFFLS